ncbi:MAG: ABC transporter permease [Bacillota bacterium]
MAGFLARRFLLTVPVLFLVSLFVFSLLHFIPGDPATVILGPEAPAEARLALRQKLGLDLPLPVQYLRWTGRVLRGDLGRSLVDNQPVSLLIAQRLPATLELAVFSFALATAIALPLGILGAVRRRTVTDYASSIFALAGLSVPHFWLGILLIILFALRLRWLPASGYVPLTDSLARNLAAMVLPAVATGFRSAATVARFMRSSLLDVLRAEHVRTARAKGLPEWAVLLRHGVRNALIPVITASGLQVAGLLSGLVITETIFTIPGFGRLIVDAIFTRDIPVVQGAVLVSALMVIGINLVVDVLYALADPRIKVSTLGGTA